MDKAFEYLKKTFPSNYRDLVLEHKAVNKVISFCDKQQQYLLFTGMFPEVNGGKGINEELETYFVNFLVDKYHATAVARASAFVEEDRQLLLAWISGVRMGTFGLSKTFLRWMMKIRSQMWMLTSPIAALKILFAP